MDENKFLTFDLRNVYGLGAKIFCFDLMTSILETKSDQVECVLIPDTDFWKKLSNHYLDVKFILCKRNNSYPLFRLFQLFIPLKISKHKSYFVLGDIPLNIAKGNQIVLLHNPHMVKTKKISIWTDFKLFINKFFFKRNLNFSNVIVVQTEQMKKKLINSYKLKNDILVEVIKFPPPQKFVENLDFLLDYRQNFSQKIKKLNLFYPASNYKHKNHSYLKNISKNMLDSSIHQIICTVNKSISLKYNFPTYVTKKINYVGEISYDQVMIYYQNCDALLFLSLDESLGLPLLEAAILGIPIVVPRLPYSIDILGQNYPFLFDINNTKDFLKKIKLAYNFKNGDKIYSPTLSSLQSSLRNANWKSSTKKFLSVNTNQS